jgi:hypothetical protein
MNKKFLIGQRVVCTFGINRDREFVVEAILNNSYSCSSVDINDEKYYEYNDDSLKVK